MESAATPCAACGGDFHDTWSSGAGAGCLMLTARHLCLAATQNSTQPSLQRMQAAMAPAKWLRLQRNQLRIIFRFHTAMPQARGHPPKYSLTRSPCNSWMPQCSSSTLSRRVAMLLRRAWSTKAKQTGCLGKTKARQEWVVGTGYGLLHVVRKQLNLHASSG